MPATDAPQDLRTQADDHFVSRHPIRLAAAVTLLMSGLAWIVNSNPWSGPVVVVLTPTHGVHSNDWLTFALWGVGLVVAFPGWAGGSVRRLQTASLERSDRRRT